MFQENHQPVIFGMFVALVGCESSTRSEVVHHKYTFMHSVGVSMGEAQ